MRNREQRSSLRMTASDPNRITGRVTIGEIARVAQVAPSTASMVLNNAAGGVKISERTKQRVIEAARVLGYTPNSAARSLRTGRSNTVLMVIFDLADHNALYRLEGMEAYLVPRDYSLRLCTVNDRVGLKGYSGILRSGRADGVILTGIPGPQTYPLLRDLCAEAQKLGKPVVSTANAFPPGYVKWLVTVDNVSGARQAVDHLMHHGHRRIAFIGMRDIPFATERLEGYELAHEKGGIPMDSDLMVLGDRTLVWYREAVVALARSRDFSAMFCVTDAIAMVALSAMSIMRKRVPEDCAIVGFNDDNGLVPFTVPPLTTVRNPFHEVGEKAAETLVNLIEGRPVDIARIPVSLAIRQSCGCPSPIADEPTSEINAPVR